MDLVSTLASQLGLDGQQAEGVAGVVLGMVRDQVGGEETAKLDEAVPEIAGWSDTAKQLLTEQGDPPDAEPEEAGLMGTLMAAAGSGLGNQILGAVAGKQAQETAGAVALLGKLGVQPSHAGMVAPMLIDFLSDRVGGEWVSRILKAAPILAGLQADPEPSPTEDALGAVTGMLGGLFGKS